MSLSIHPTDDRLRWQGAVSVERSHDGAQPWRVPHEDKLLYADVLLERAAMPAGVRLSFRSDTTLVAGSLDAVQEMPPLDLCIDGELVSSLPLNGQSSFRFDDLPPRDKMIELWLPQFGPFRLRALELSDGATLAPFEEDRPRWITYGSSITQCRTAASPTQTWPGVVARAANLHLTCLGFGGQCHLDPMIARLMRDLPADLLSMCVGINIQGGATLNARTFRPGIIGFVQIIREKHPDTPLAVISPIISPPRETTPNVVGFHLQGMREEVAAAVAAMQAHGDQHIHYVNGLDLFGPEQTHLLPDELHPSAEGYRLLGQRFLDKVMPILLADSEAK